MRYEVEQKYPIDDSAAIEEKLASMGVNLDPPTDQIDQYFNHPARDFAATDEALRIRQSGPRSYVTYKGPRVDTTSKTRREIELPLPGLASPTDALQDLLEALGFTPVASVRKKRRRGTMPWRGWTCEIALDHVDGLGCFVELELDATTAQLPEAQQALRSLAEALGLANSESRSYLELLMQETR